jgi:hypothetical protein
MDGTGHERYESRSLSLKSTAGFFALLRNQQKPALKMMLA